MRIALDPARRPALRDLLAALAGGAAPPSEADLRLARAGGRDGLPRMGLEPSDRSKHTRVGGERLNALAQRLRADRSSEPLGLRQRRSDRSAGVELERSERREGTCLLGWPHDVAGKGDGFVGRGETVIVGARGRRKLGEALDHAELLEAQAVGAHDGERFGEAPVRSCEVTDLSVGFVRDEQDLRLHEAGPTGRRLALEIGSRVAEVSKRSARVVPGEGRAGKLDGDARRARGALMCARPREMSGERSRGRVEASRCSVQAAQRELGLHAALDRSG